jgi:hypothetical protein
MKPNASAREATLNLRRKGGEIAFSSDRKNFSNHSSMAQLKGNEKSELMSQEEKFLQQPLCPLHQIKV